MHVFVTGATGFIGMHTVLALREAGHSVRLGVRNAQKMRALYTQYGIEVDDFAVGQITDALAIERALDGCDAVVHTAALVSLDANQAAQMYRTNVVGTRNVVGGAVDKGIESIIHISSAAALFDPRLTGIDESTPPAPANTAYARSKVDSEKYVQGLIDRGARVAMTYPTGVMGPDDPAMSEGNQSLLFILNNMHVITSSGLQIIDVRELAAAHVKLLEGKKSGRYLVAGHYVSWQEFGELLEDIVGRSIRTLRLPGALLRALGSGVDLIGRIRPLDTPVTREGTEFATRWVVCNDSKLRKELGMTYQPLRATVADTIIWLARAGHIDTSWAKHIRETA
jgi:nucleoside-diphosphate-sugar epimerase